MWHVRLLRLAITMMFLGTILCNWSESLLQFESYFSSLTPVACFLFKIFQVRCFTQNELRII